MSTVWLEEIRIRVERTVGAEEILSECKADRQRLFQLVDALLDEREKAAAYWKMMDTLYAGEEFLGDGVETSNAYAVAETKTADLLRAQRKTD